MSRKPFHHQSEAVRRQDLIDATLDCIADHGLRGTTVRQIAQRAGVTGGLIRHYFSSKEMLMQAAYLDLMGRMAHSALAASSTHASPAERLRAFILANFTAGILDDRLLSLWATFIGQIRIDPSLAAIHREGYLGFRDKLAHLIADFHAGTELAGRTDIIRGQAIALNAVIDGLWLEGCMAADLFTDGELGAIALSSAAAILGRPLGPARQEGS